MIANGWRPLTSYESKNSLHSSASNPGSSILERHSSSHPVHGMLHEHMMTSEKLTSKQNKQSHDYNPPNILGSFNVFGHSMPKVRANNEASKAYNKHQMAASETREFSFLVPPPREPVRYEIDPYRKVIIRDNEAYLRHPQPYVISQQVQQGDIRNSQYFPKGSSNSHVLSATQNRPIVTEYNNGGIAQIQQQQQQQQPPRTQHVPFESLKLSNAKLYLQPPTSNGALNFANEQQQASENLYDRYPSSLTSHNSPPHDGPGQFYSQINHPSPSYKTQTLERDPSFLVHESHEVSYATLPSTGSKHYGNFRPSTPYDHAPERYSTARPTLNPNEKFVPSKADNVHQQYSHNGQYGQNNNPNLENTIISPEPTYSNGIINTYYISEQQSLTPPQPTWSVPVKSKVTSDINEVLPKANRPAKFKTEQQNPEQTHPTPLQNIQNFLFPRPEIQQQHQQQLQQQHYVENPLALINQQAPEPAYDTPESISLKHFNEQQFRLQQQLIARDRERLREHELQMQQEQIDLGRLAAVRNQEKPVKAFSRPTQETPRPTVEYIDTTISYLNGNNQAQIQDVPLRASQQIFPQEYQVNQFEPIRSNLESSGSLEAGNGSFADVSKITAQTEKSVSSYESTETPTSGHRSRPRKPIAGTSYEQVQRRRKPTTPLNEDRQQAQQHLSTPQYEDYHQPQHHLSTLSPNPIVQSPGSLYSHLSTTESSTADVQTFSLSSVTTPTSTTSTTPRPRTRRPTAGGVSAGRRRRPTTTTTPEPEITTLPITYEQNQDTLKYEKIETDASRRRRIKPSAPAQYEEEPTSTEKKRYEIQNYGAKFGYNEQSNDDFVTEIPSVQVDTGNEQVSPQQTYTYTNEQDGSVYTPTYDQQVTTRQEVSNYETSGYPTSATIYSTQGNPTENQYVDNSETSKSVYTNIPLEELFVNTERIVTTTSAPSTTTARATTTAGTSRYTATKSSAVTTSTTESVQSTRTPSYRTRPMRFGNTTRPRFSIKDYKSRMDLKNRMTSTTESPIPSRQKFSGLKNQQDTENATLESTTPTGRYRHMSRVSYRISSTTPSYQSRRTEGSNSTTERSTKYTPKRRLHNNHLYRSKISTTTTADPTKIDGELSTRHSAVRHENVFSAAIRRRPQMKHQVFTQSSTRKESTEMIPEETSFYSSPVTQLLVTEPETESSASNETSKVDYVSQIMKINEDRENVKIVTPISQVEVSSGKETLTSDGSLDESQQGSTENLFEYSQATTGSSVENVGQTEALVKSDNNVTANSQSDEDLFARASQSVADLTSSASALYDKPGLFKAVSVAPSASDNSAIISNRFKIGQEKPTLPIEAFFHELSNKN